VRALVVLMLVAGVARAQNVSPGPLAADHAKLEGVDNCIKCHSGGGNAIDPRSCLACHKTLDARLAAKQGYHATVGNDCASCHPDHRGVKASLVRWPGGAPEKLDHEKTGYKLTGKHASTKCRDCHKPAFITGPVTAEEKPKTYLGLSQACATCHEDVHKPSLGEDCERCHDTAAWHNATTQFDHSKTKYPLRGAHAKVDCEKCHGVKLSVLRPKFALCTDCHKDPHAAAMGDEKACTLCHSETAWKDSHYDQRTHPKTLPLANAHAIDCAKCHDAKLDKRPPVACVACHPDPHRPSLGTRCEQCHTATAWTKAAPPAKVEFHDRTNYPLRGMHVQVKCDACHDPRKPAAKRYRPLPHGKCLDCHKDPHMGETDKPCESCHGVEGWKPARFEIADHAKTRYPLEGAHQAVPCTKCHDAPPKSPGFNRGNPPCEACHADPHKGQFAGQTCATCHAVAAWSPSTFTKDAHAKAGFALTGKHDVACGRCHAGTFKGLSPECGTCHDDHHAGQFAPRKCTECHAGAVWKPAPGFDHGKTFVLRGQHAKAACERCHPKVRLTASLETEVYALGARSRECVGCHRSVHGEPGSALAQATRACTTCHGEASWRDVKTGVQFDHAATGAPLVGGHATAVCSNCHTPVHRKVPRMPDCAGCHADRHYGRNGDRCEGCHSPRTWKQDQVLVAHDTTRLPLRGAHAVQGCVTCHKDLASGNYRGLDPACRGCHLHTVEDRRPHPDHTKDVAFLTCENCHTVMGWRPAHIDHDRFWPLTGKHQSTLCESCHATGQPYAAAPRECLYCHQKDLALANTTTAMHDTFGIACKQCHGTSTWKDGRFNHHWFSIPHHNASQCDQCHTVPNAPAMFTCFTGGCHAKGPTDSRHRGISGYLYEPASCYHCHPHGGAG
jgi:hypothetical protein